MQVKLMLNNRTVKCLQEHLGKERVTIIEKDADGYSSVEFELKDRMDVLYIIHAGQDSGLELAHYGVDGKPKEKVSVTVA